MCEKRKSVFFPVSSPCVFSCTAWSQQRSIAACRFIECSNSNSLSPLLLSKNAHGILYNFVALLEVFFFFFLFQDNNNSNTNQIFFKLAYYILLIQTTLQLRISNGKIVNIQRPQIRVHLYTLARVERVDAVAVVVAEEPRIAHHVEERARGGDASIPRHEEFHHLSRGEEFLQRIHQCRICAESTYTK